METEKNVGFLFGMPAVDPVFEDRFEIIAR
jgi:hypothetical protein